MDLVKRRTTYKEENKSESQSARVKKLIYNDDVLSTTEQEEIIEHFAHSLRSTAQLLRVAACLEFVVAFVYVMLLVSGSPLIDHYKDEHLAQLRHAAETERAQRGVHGLGQGIRAFTSSWAVPFLSGVAMLLSSVLLILGGMSSFQVCRRLRVNVEALKSTEARDLGRSPTASSHDTVKTEPDRAPKHLSLWKRCCTYPVFANRVLALIALPLSLYWLVVFLRGRRASNALYAQLGMEKPYKAFLSTVDELLPMLLATWQPVFHFCIAIMVQSLLNTRDNLVKLSEMKYRFEKL